MDKYQEFLFKGWLRPYFIFFRCCPSENEIEGNSKQYGTFDKDADTFTLTQDEDINIVDYVLMVSNDAVKSANIESIYIFANGKWEAVGLSPYGQQALVYKISINFNNRIEKIKFIFKNGLADEYILNIKYIEANKEAYYAKQEQNKKDDLLKAASIKHSTGNDLVNIYFQPCSDEYDRTEIILYKDSQMLAKYKDDGVFFKSISGLAYGTYEYVVKQFGKNNKILLETDKIRFSINRPNYGGKPTVII